MFRRLFIFLFCLYALALNLQTVLAAQANHMALLVGVNQYKNLGASEQLEGSLNDVKAMKELLIERFRFAESEVTVLVDNEATGSAIRAELANLIKRVSQLPAGNPPVQIVFHFSGHGSQVLDQEGAEADEPSDGLDETLVPHDAARQGGPQDIRDDEIYTFADRICAGGKARLWIVLDCCHSGSGARGVTKVRKLTRELARKADRNMVRGNAEVKTRHLPRGAVALYACRAVEVEPEFQDGDVSYGLLTRFLVEVLRNQPVVSQLSYDQLRDAIATRYRRHRSVTQAPTPLVEGDKSAVVCSAGVQSDLPAYKKVILEGRQRDKVLLLAGALHGVTSGSLYQIYDHPEKISQVDAEPTAWLRVTDVDGTTSKGEVFAWEAGEQVPYRLPRNFGEGFAVERHHDYGDYVMRIRVVKCIGKDRDSPALKLASPEMPEAIRQILQKQPQRDANVGHFLKLVGEQEPCDFVLRIDGHWVALFPSTGIAHVPRQVAARRADVPETLVGGWGTDNGPIDLTRSQSANQLHLMLRKIARTRNLIRIVSSQFQSAENEADSPRVKLELIRVEDYDNDFKVTKSHQWPMEESDPYRGVRLMRDEDLYSLRVTNLEESGPPLYFSVLQIDGNMGIDAIYPYFNPDRPWEEPETPARLDPKQVFETEIWQCNSSSDAEQDVSEDPSAVSKSSIYGKRYAIVLVTRQPNDFFRLAQSSLITVRGRGSSLDELLREATFARTRDGRLRQGKRYDKSWGADFIQWEVLSKVEE